MGLFGSSKKRSRDAAAVITGAGSGIGAAFATELARRGGLYCMPQPDARIGWGIKRFTPTVYTRAVGLATRVTT
jgi:hypothetical protein